MNFTFTFTNDLCVRMCMKQSTDEETHIKNINGNKNNVYDMMSYCITFIFVLSLFYYHSYHIILYYIIPYDVILYHMYDIILHPIILYDVMRYDVIQCYTIWFLQTRKKKEERFFKYFEFRLYGRIHTAGSIGIWRF